MKIASTPRGASEARRAEGGVAEAPTEGGQGVCGGWGGCTAEGGATGSPRVAGEADGKGRQPGTWAAETSGVETAATTVMGAGGEAERERAEGWAAELVEAVGDGARS